MAIAFSEPFSRIGYCYPGDLHLRKEYARRLNDASNNTVELCEGISNLEHMDLTSDKMAKLIIIGTKD